MIAICRCGYLSLECLIFVAFASLDLMRMVISKDARMISRCASDSVIVRLRLCKYGRMVVGGDKSFLDVVDEETGALTENIGILTVATDHFIVCNKIRYADMLLLLKRSSPQGLYYNEDIEKYIELNR